MAAPTIVGTPANNYAGGGSGLTVSLTVPAGATHLVAIIGYYYGTGYLDSVTFGGVALEKVFHPFDNAATYGAEVWVLENPTPGTATLSFNSHTFNYFAGGGICLSGCTGLFMGGAGGGFNEMVNPSTDAWTPVDALILDLVTSDYNTPTYTPDASQTVIWTESGTANTNQHSAASYKTANAGDRVTMSWTTNSQATGHIVVVAAGSGGGGSSSGVSRARVQRGM